MGSVCLQPQWSVGVLVSTRSKNLMNRSIDRACFQQRIDQITLSPSTPVLVVRVALATDEYARLVRLCTVGLGIEPAALWTGETGRAVLLPMGRATTEIFDEPHAAAVDQIEVGERASGSGRCALEVPDVQAALDRLPAHGATLAHPPMVTPWGHRNARMPDPDRLQITVFQGLDLQERGDQDEHA